MQHELFFQETITAGSSVTSFPVKLRDGKTDHALEYRITGSGTVTLTPYTSISGDAWISNGAKGNDLTSSSGPDSDGKDNIPLTLKPGEFLTVKVTVADATAVVSLWFVQK